MLRDRPDVVLTRHFFTSLFDFGVLSEDGAEALKRGLLGGLAVAIALGLLLTRVFMAKYGALSAEPPDAYWRAVVADHAFLIAVPMWIVASAVGLVCQSLFPDQTDFRILMAEPLSRATIFGAKLASLLLFSGLFVAGSHLALLPLAALTMIGAAKAGALVSTASAFVISSLLASLFAALAIVAVQGALVLLAPRARLLAFSGAVRSVLVAGLVLSLPLVTRLPATAGAFASGASWLRWTPPAWFAGLERWLIGDAINAVLAAQAAIGTAMVFIVAVVSYVVLYRRFDRVTTQPAHSVNGVSSDRSLAVWNGRAPVRDAIARFVSITIRRSILHQSLVVGALAAAGAFVLNSLMGADGWREPFHPRHRETLIWTLLWSPMTMMFMAIPALRLALSVPLELRSNWVFRMTEDAEGRAETVAANVRVVVALAVVVPVVLVAPVQWSVLGRSTLIVMIVETSIGWLMAEWLMAGWRRIPFTCSYMPAKGFVPHMVVKAFGSYIVYSLMTGALLRLSLARPRVGFALALVVCAIAGALAIRRAHRAPEQSLTFEDELPADVTQLRLNAD